MLEEVLECVVKGTVSNMPMRKWSNDKMFFEYNLACSVTQSCLTLCNPIDCSPPGSSVHGIFPGKDTGVGCHFLLQGIFPTRGWNRSLLCLLRWQAGSLPPAPRRKLLVLLRAWQGWQTTASSISRSPSSSAITLGRAGAGDSICLAEGFVCRFGSPHSRLEARSRLWL